MIPLAGQPFKRLRPGDQAQLAPALERYPQALSGYTFATLVAWDAVFHYEWCRPDPDTVLMACLVEPDENRHLLQPVGAFPKATQEALVSGLARLPYPLKMYGVTERFLAAHPDFVSRFSVVEEPGAANYVYRAEDLALLAGRKFAPKRNHLAQAGREYAWVAGPLTEADAPEAIALAKRLCEAFREEGGKSWERDCLACALALEHLHGLGLRGTGVRVDGKLVAFSIWERLDAITAVVHFERAERSLKGLYQVINHEAAKVMHAEGFQQINREEDLGDEGLRKAKLSYHPTHLEKSYTLTFKL